MKAKIIVLSLAIIAVLVVSGCIGQKTIGNSDPKVRECVDLCLAAHEKNISLSDGPCLGNPIKIDGDWVCDIIHVPKNDIDNLPENQCSAYRNGTAIHYIELDEDCRLVLQK